MDPSLVWDYFDFKDIDFKHMIDFSLQNGHSLQDPYT